jgi:hypothetical protein
MGTNDLFRAESCRFIPVVGENRAVVYLSYTKPTAPVRLYLALKVKCDVEWLRLESVVSWVPPFTGCPENLTGQILQLFQSDKHASWGAWPLNTEQFRQTPLKTISAVFTVQQNATSPRLLDTNVSELRHSLSRPQYWYRVSNSRADCCL